MQGGSGRGGGGQTRRRAGWQAGPCSQQPTATASSLRRPARLHAHQKRARRRASWKAGGQGFKPPTVHKVEQAFSHSFQLAQARHGAGHHGQVALCELQVHQAMQGSAQWRCHQGGPAARRRRGGAGRQGGTAQAGGVGRPCRGTSCCCVG